MKVVAAFLKDIGIVIVQEPMNIRRSLTSVILEMMTYYGIIISKDRVQCVERLWKAEFRLQESNIIYVLLLVSASRVPKCQVCI